MMRGIIAGLGGALIAVAIVLAGQEVGRALFPITSESNIPPSTSVGAGGLPPNFEVFLYVSRGYYAAHAIGCVLAGIAAGVWSALIAPEVRWPAWLAGIALAITALFIALWLGPLFCFLTAGVGSASVGATGWIVRRLRARRS